MAVRKPRKRVPEEPEQTSKQSDLTALSEYVKENPLISAAAVAFIVLCALAGLFYRVGTDVRAKEATTEYAQALANEDPALRAAQLAAVADTSGPWQAEALYMMGEAAFQAHDFEKAQTAFERVRQQFPEEPFTPDAVEGLGNIEENNGNYEAALALYREVQSKWSGSFASLRQEINIARCHERMGNMDEAVRFYQAQASAFPDSSVAAQAERALDRLRLTHPALFPEEGLKEELETVGPDSEPAEPVTLEMVPTPLVSGPVSDPVDAETSADEAEDTEVPIPEVGEGLIATTPESDVSEESSAP